MNDMSHAIIRLAIHLPQEQTLHFRAGHEREAIAAAAKKDTTLTAFFKLNSMNENARQFLYHEIPTHFVFHGTGTNACWRERQQGGDRILARMYAVCPKDVERYFLRTLLLHVKGPTSYDAVKTFNGVVHGTFSAAAKARGLLKDDAEWVNCLEEAAMTQHPRQLRFLFAVICLYAVELTDQKGLFERFESDLAEDLRRSSSDATARNAALYEIDETLRINGKSCADFGLPSPLHALAEDETSWDAGSEAVHGAGNYQILNSQQRDVVDQVLADITAGTGTTFFVNGPGGTGMF